MKPLTPSSPHAIVMVGIPGSGKTTFAERFANTFQAPYLNAGALALDLGIDLKVAQQAASTLLDEILKTGKTLVYESASDSRVERQRLQQRIVKAGYKPLFVWVQTESAEAKRRATRKRTEGALSGDAFDARIKTFTPPTASEHLVVISGKHTYSTQLKVVLKRIAGPREAVPPRERPSRTVIIR